MYFFTDDLLSLIINETSLFSTEKDPNKSLVIESGDIKKFIGICTTIGMMLLAINWFSRQCQKIGLNEGECLR